MIIIIINIAPIIGIVLHHHIYQYYHYFPNPHVTRDPEKQYVALFTAIFTISHIYKCHIALYCKKPPLREINANPGALKLHTANITDIFLP